MVSCAARNIVSQPSWPRLIVSGLAAGAVINICEWTAHAVWLDAAWQQTFAADRKTHAGLARRR
jgi:hypothetical protein